MLHSSGVTVDIQGRSVWVHLHGVTFFFFFFLEQEMSPEGPRHIPFMFAFQYKSSHHMSLLNEQRPDPSQTTTVLHGQSAWGAAGGHRTLLTGAGGWLKNGSTPNATGARHILHLDLLLLYTDEGIQPPIPSTHRAYPLE